MKEKIAKLIREASYDELRSLASDLVNMQTNAKEDGAFEWVPNELYGEFGMMEMLNSWAENQDDE